MSDVNDLERDIAATRERLNGTLDAIQSRLTVSGIVDEVLGQAGVPKVEGQANFMLGLLRRHPVPVMVTAAVVGFLIHRNSVRKAQVAAVRGPAADPLATPASAATTFSDPVLSAMEVTEATARTPTSPPATPTLPHAAEPSRVL